MYNLVIKAKETSFDGFVNGFGCRKAKRGVFEGRLICSIKLAGNEGNECLSQLGRGDPATDKVSK